MADLAVRNTASNFAAGTTPQYRGSVAGELVTPDWYFQMSREGRAFSVSNPTNGTALAVGGTSFSDTAPAFSIDVPGGTTLIPWRAMLHQAGTVAGAAITVLFAYDSIQRYSSSGTALTIRSNRIDQLAANTAAPSSVAKAYYNSTNAAVSTNGQNFFGDILLPTVTSAAANALNHNVDWSATGSAIGAGPLLFLVGPANWTIYTFAGTTQPSWFFRFDWIELPSTVAIQ